MYDIKCISGRQIYDDNDDDDDDERILTCKQASKVAIHIVALSCLPEPCRCHVSFFPIKAGLSKGASDGQYRWLL